ncbi:MAG: hypothetical protein IT435_00165 [Phycisphaerales bacterium]|nr:hypothetical protein [Phycisphaerales bacterium]
MAKRVLGTSVGMAAAVGLAMLAAASQPSWGAVTVYDNSDGTFFWKLSIRDVDGTPYPGTFLDITQPPTQSGARRPGTLGKWYYPNQSSDEPAIRNLIGETGVQTARTTDLVTFPWDDIHIQTRPIRDYDPGERVEASANWHVGAPYFFHLPFSYSFEEGTPGIKDPTYVGIRVKLADNQWHYGWIYFTEYQWPMMWAYETEPNVPIQVPIPEPTGASLIVCGLSLSFRRHRS